MPATPVVLYARVSSYQQKKAGDLQRQIDFMKHYCKNKGYTIVKIFKDVGSGINDNRRGLVSLLRAAIQKGFKKVVVNYIGLPGLE
ncbi:MAG: recombinase family protein [Promethearchaeota archaeon]